MRTSIGYLSWHPAPYRDAFLKRIMASDRLDVTLYTAKTSGEEHTFTPPDYQTEILMPRRKSDIGVLWRMMKKLVFGGFDYTFWPGFMSWPVVTCEAVSALLGKKYVFCTDCVGEHKTTRIKKWLQSFIIRHAYALLVGGNAGRHFFRVEYSVPDEKILDGVYSLEGDLLEGRILQYRKGKAKIRSQYGLRTDDKVFLMVANITPKRHYPITVAGFRAFSKKHTGCRFVICGAGTGLSEMQKIAEEDKSVVVIPGVPFDEMLKLYAMSDVYVHGGKEPASTALQIGAIAHLPILSSKAIGLAWDVLINGETGFEIVDFTDSMQWFSGFEEILSRQSRWGEMGRKARDCSRKLDADVVASNLIRFVTA